MNTLFQIGKIDLLEKGDANNPIYILKGDVKFYNTEYKIMENYSDLLRCYNATLNGMTELVYLTENLVPLSVVLPHLKEDTFVSIAINMCKSVMRIADNGFLNWQHIDFAKERVFVQLSDQTVYYVYLPIKGIYLAPESIDKEIETFIGSLTKEIPDPDASKMAAIRNHVQSNRDPLIDFIDFLSGLLDNNSASQPQHPNGILKLYNEEKNHTLVIDKPSFSIGKLVTAVDGVISYSKFVGRVHCQIVNNNGEYYIYDMDSMNGTAVNDAPVKPGKGFPLKNGDRLKIANVEFIVDIEEV